jgi:hypothetical protein
MTSLRYLTPQELNYITSDVKFQKTELKNILRTKAKVFKLTKPDLNKLKKTFTKLMNEKNIPRYLSEEEIDYILENLPEIPTCISDIREFNREKILETLKFDLRTYKVCPSKKNLKVIKEKITETFMRSLCQPGESVGSNGAMSLGQAITQATLDAFHSAGSSNSKDADMKYIDQLLYPNTKRLISSCNAHFKDKNLAKEEIIKSYNKKFKGVSVEDLIISKEILIEVPEEDKQWYENYKTIYGIEVDTGNKFLRLKINVYKCYVYGIRIKDISNIIEKTTKIKGGKKSINCVTSSTHMGIIDIHVDEEFIRQSVNDFATKGVVFKTCEKRYRGKTIISDSGEVQRTYLKTILDENTELPDLISVFLSVILETCFKDMNITGIKGVENIIVIDNKLSSFLKFKKVYNDQDIVKYTSKEYGVLPNEFYRLYYVYIDYYAINILGIPVSKFIKFLELCGMELIEDKTDENTRPVCVFLVPEMSDEIEDGKERFIKKDGKIFDTKTEKEVITPEEPTRLIGRKLRESENYLRETILNSEKSNDLEDFPDIYRYGIYCYIKVYGKNINKNILKDRTVDPFFTSSNSVSDIMEYYGIESSRLFFIREYNSIGEIQKMNPVNIELLVDFQTAMGQILSVTSTDIAKHGKSALVAASFEQPLEAFKKSSSMGNKDIINNIPSCLMTGKKCINGTGIVEIEFDDEYKENKFDNQDQNLITLRDVDQREILGGCFAAGKFVKDSPEIEEKDEKEALEQTEEIKIQESSYSGGKALDLISNIDDIEIAVPDVETAEANYEDSALDI